MVRLLLCLWWPICHYLQQLRVCDETCPHSEAGDCHVCRLLYIRYVHMHSWHKIQLERRFWLLLASHYQRSWCSRCNDFRKILHPCVSWQLGLWIFQLCHEREVAIPQTQDVWSCSIYTSKFSLHGLLHSIKRGLHADATHKKFRDPEMALRCDNWAPTYNDNDNHQHYFTSHALCTVMLLALHSLQRVL